MIGMSLERGVVIAGGAACGAGGGGEFAQRGFQPMDQDVDLLDTVAAAEFADTVLQPVERHRFALTDPLRHVLAQAGVGAGDDVVGSFEREGRDRQAVGEQEAGDVFQRLAPPLVARGFVE